ncbi:MAG TPA: amino acid adenylation domain-containing protein, partial [Aquabacterium sp.]|nr:amino acid adenylation domain-containing protein [Aquabacterium sp.]
MTNPTRGNLDAKQLELVLRRLKSKRVQVSPTASQAIPQADRSQPVPLSWAQTRLWFIGQLDPSASKAYHLPTALRLDGQLQTAAFRRALDRIVARHESLRTSFPTVHGEALTVIASPDVGFALQEQDLRGLSPAEQEARIQQATAHEADSPFDLGSGPLCRGQLLRLADDCHILLITQHHMVSDGWSIGVLVSELVALYTAYAAGQPDPLPPLPIQYADFAAWQRQRTGGDGLQAQAEFWRSYLGGAPAVLHLPFDRKRPEVQSYAGGLEEYHLPGQGLQALRSLAQRHKSTLFMALVAAWAVLMARLSGQHDIVIGTPTSGRDRSELEPLIGFFANTLALRVQLSPQMTVADLLAQVNHSVRQALAHQDLPFEQVVEVLKPERSLSYNPIFQAMLALNNTPGGGSDELPGLRLSAVKQPQTTSHFDLILNLSEDDDKLGGAFLYSADLFDVATVRRFGQYFTRLLQAMVQGDAQPVLTLAMLPDEERQQVLHTWNQSAAPYEAQRCTHELVEAQAQAQPDAVAVVQGDEVLSYGELNAQANQLARHLVSLGVCPGERVAVCVGRSPRLLVALLGVLKAGGAYVPLDPAYPGERLGHMLADSQPRVIVGESTASAELQALLALAAARASQPLPVLELDSPEAWHGLETHNLPAPAEGARALAYVIYTSGSTGLPKGVMVEQRSLNNLIAWHARQFGLAWGERSSCTAGLGFDACAWEIWPTLASGASLLLAPAHTEGNPQALLQWWQAQDLGVSFLVTPLAEHALSHGLANPGLRQLLVGGDRLRRWPQGLPAGQTLVNNYGPTENTVVATSGALSAHDAVLHIGRPVANTRVYILDAQGQPAPLGVVGELCIGGHGVARGYLNQPEMTAERFVADPFSEEPGARMYKTGDLGRWLADGTIEYLGRNDHQVKIRGFRIELGEIEAQLAKAPGVAEVVVLAREAAGGDKRLVAYYRGEAPAQALREHASGQLPPYMVPAAFVALERFPLTPNGKLDRAALPAPEGEAYAQRGYEAPVGDTEQALATLWAELLGVAQVGRHDNFFELGGHSLLAVSLIERMRQAGLQADVRALFAAGSLAELAQAVGGESHAVVVPPNLIPADAAEIRPEMLTLVTLSQQEIDLIVAQVPGGAANVQDIYPLAPLQEGILFHHLMAQEGDPYLLPNVYDFEDPASVERFVQTVQAVIDRHDILRTAVLWQGLAQPVQVVLRHAPLQLQTLDIDPANGDVAQQMQQRLDPLHHRIAVDQAPLLHLHVAEDP